MKELLSRKIDFSFTSIILIITVFLISLLLLLMLYKSFKKTCLWCVKYRIKMITKLNVIFFSIPFLVWNFESFNEKHFVKTWMSYLMIGVFIIIPIIINIFLLGFKYGIILSIYRMVVAFLVGFLVCGMLAFVAIAGIAAGFGLSIYLEDAYVFVTLDGEPYTLKKVGDNKYIDAISGSSFYPMENGTWINDEGDIFYPFH